MKLRLALWLPLLIVGGFAADLPDEKASAATKTPQTLEARKRQFASVQKELEAARPGENATPEEIIAFLELALDGYGKFAKANAKTAEGFEAAASLAELLVQVGHPEALKYSELAVETAPIAGVDLKRVGLCWAFVATGKLRALDGDGAKSAIEKIKELDKDMYAQFSAQLDMAIKQLEASKQAQREAEARLQPGQAPFPIEDTDIKGEKFSLAALKDQVVIVDFWASWCAPCIKELPNLIKLYNEHKDKGLAIVGISLDKNAGQLQQSIEEHGIAWPILSDNMGWQNVIAQKWNIRAIPKTFILDRKGIIRHIDMHGQALAEAVAKLLKEK
ncbi:MAG: TlpA disulfide reductase family protein [Planctomycetota bacterium]